MENINSGFSKSKAQDYIDEHNLEPVLAEMLNTVVYEKVKKPEVFMIKYLANLMSKEEKLRNGIHVPEDNVPVSKPLVKFPVNSKNEYLKRNLTKDLWNNLKYIKSKFGATISEVLKNEKEGVTLLDADCLDKFRDLIVPMINDTHGINAPYRIIEKFNTQTENVKETLFSKFVFTNLQFAKFEYLRNLKDYPFPLRSDSKHCVEIIQRVALALNHLEKENTHVKTVCFKYSDNQEAFMKLITENRIHLHSAKLNNLAIFFVQNEESNTETINSMILVNDLAHVRLISTSFDYSKILNCYEKVSNLHQILSQFLNFEYDTHFGFLNSEIEKLGNAVTFTGEIKMEKLFTNHQDQFEEIKKFLNASSVEGSASGLQINLIQNLKQTENDFLEHVFQQIYSLEFIETHYQQPAIEDLSSTINENLENLSMKEKKFLTSLKKAYESAYPLHKYSHFFSTSGTNIDSDVNLNSLLTNSLKNLTDSSFFSQFPIFYSTFLINYRNVYDEIIYRKTLFYVNRNIEDSRDSLTSLSNFTPEVIKKVNFTIRRNLSHFNMVHLLDEKQKNQIYAIIKETVEYIASMNNLECEEIDNSFNFCKKQVSIHVNLLDHLTFQLNIGENPTELVQTLNLFFKIYKEVSSRFEFNKVEYLSSSHLGFFTNDLRFLGAGADYSIEVVNHANVDFALNEILKKDGFYFEKTEGSDTSILGCNMNVNIGTYKLFNITSEMLKTFKVPTQEKNSSN